MGACPISEIKDITQYLPEEFESNNGKIKKEDVIKNELIGIYFSAHWCGPCKAFTPKLAQFYKKVNSEKKQIEIIFNSLDKDLKTFKEYFSTMPWIATPYESQERGQIEQVCGILGIPLLVIFDNKGNIIDDNGKNVVELNGDESINIWKNKIQKKNENKEN